MDVLLQLMDDGGFMMWVIFGISIAGLTLFVERVYGLFLARGLSTRAFLQGTLDLVKQRRFSDALGKCNVRTRHPLVSVVRAGIVRANRREKEIERAMENEMLAALPQLQKGIGTVALFANLATLLGLLGTILGLMTAFSAVAAATATERQEALAAGISQAMYTTAFGILVAVILLVCHHILTRRAETIILAVEGGASATVVALAAAAAEE